MDVDAELHEALLGIAGERSAEAVLQQTADQARRLTAADYAAVGVPDGGGGFARFITSGISDALAERIGPLPRTHGLLGAQLERADPYRTDDIRADPRFGGWPAPHPAMVPFLGVPVWPTDTEPRNDAEPGLGDLNPHYRPIGAVYVTRDESGDPFADADLARLQVLADHAALAIEHAQLWERSRELAMAAEREHLARELHDAMTQRLFSLRLLAQAAADDLHRDPHAAEAALAQVSEQAGEILAELRGLIGGLGPARLETDGLATTLRRHAELVGRAHQLEVHVDAALGAEPEPHARSELFRIAQEALHNIVRHARARRVQVVVRDDGRVLRLEVDDDGVGFDPGDRRVRATRLGLTSMRHRARAVGGALRVESAPGRGTRVRLEVPRDR